MLRALSSISVCNHQISLGRFLLICESLKLMVLLAGFWKNEAEES
jgi:hypothetical protein